MSIAATDANPVVLASNVAIQAIAGDHMLFIGGTHDAATLTGGTESVMAFQGNNTIHTGNGDDTIRIAGSGNMVDAGAGRNLLADSGSGNTIVTPAAGQGFDDVFGYVLQNADLLDLRASLQATAWNGQQPTLSQFLHVANAGADATISVSATSGGAAQDVATLHGSGGLTLTGLLQHALV